MTDLRTPYGTRLCLSGVESRRLLETFKDFGVEHLQVSYYYLRKVFSDPAEFAEFAKPFATVIIDSGTVYHKFKTKDERLSFIGEYSAYICALDKHAYTAAVMEEGAHLEDELEDEALIYPLDDIRPVFDNDMGALFRNVKYVGVSQKEASSRGGQDIAPLFAQAKQHNAWIHLFGVSTKRLLNKYPVYSCNSSSWRSGSRYLNTYIYEGPSRGMKLVQPSDKQDAVKTERELKQIRRKQETMISVRQAPLYEKIDWRALYEGDSWEVDKGNLTQWVLNQRDYGNKAQNKYYLGEDDKRAIAERQKELLSKVAEEALHGNGRDPAQTPDDNPPLPHSGGSLEEPREDIDPEDIEKPDIEGEDSEIIDADVVEEGTELPVISPPDNPVASTPAHKPTNNADLVPSGERLRPPDPRLSVLRKCDDCILAGRCPKYTPGADCSYGYPPAYHPAQLEEHVLEDAGEILAAQKDRIMQAYLEEKIDAAGLNKELGKEIERYFTIVQLLAEAQDKRDEVTFKAKGHGLLDVFKK